MEYLFVESLPKYDKCRYPLSDFLANLEDRFVLCDITNDRKKIALCKLAIGQIGEDIISSLAPNVTWDSAREALVRGLGAGSLQEEAYERLKAVARKGRDLGAVGAEAEKWARRAFPRSPDFADR